MNDGSLVSLSKEVKRWSISRDDNHIQLLGTYSGHADTVWDVVEKDDNTLITGSSDLTLKVWNKTSCECLDTLQIPYETGCLTKTKDQKRVVVGRKDGTVELRRISDLGLISSIQPHPEWFLRCICELQDESFVIGSTMHNYEQLLERWNKDGTQVQTFVGHLDLISRVIELTPDIIASSERYEVKVWKVSSGAFTL